MKTLFTLMCLVLWGYTSLAQNIQFDYDAGGNRILRKPSAALPVTLISFTAERSRNPVVGGSEEATAFLQWQTSAEINSDRFCIQRSQDGKSWLEIGSIKAIGETAPVTSVPEEFSEDDQIFNSYSFIDKIPAEGENLYRLKMIDQDDSYAYSKVRNLYFEPDILAYPNPVRSLLTLKWSTLQAVKIFNSSGKMVYETSNDGSTIDMSKLSAGPYIFKLTGKDGSIITRKIVKE